MQREWKTRTEKKNYFLIKRLNRTQGGLCWWCTKPMKIFYTRPAKNYRPENDHSTYDHLVDRYENPNRGTNINFKTVVLACYECNQMRARISSVRMGKTRQPEKIEQLKHDLQNSSFGWPTSGADESWTNESIHRLQEEGTSRKAARDLAYREKYMVQGVQEGKLDQG